MPPKLCCFVFHGRGKLCDEVSLGKTIEAGLVLKEYHLRNVAQRVLILTPAALVEQWREELAVKFGLEDFISNADSEFRDLGSAAWERFPHVVASLATARRSEHRTQISQIPYDLIIVDETHHLKNPPALLGSSSTNCSVNTFCCSLPPRSKTIWMSYTT